MILFLMSSVSGAVAAPPQPKIEAMAPIALRSRLYAQSGKPRVVNFWATWCGPCVAEIPHLVAYAASHPDVEVIMVDLDMPQLRESKVMPFLAKHKVVGITHFQLDHPDPGKAVFDVVPDFPDMVPITLVLDETGNVVKRFHRALSPADFSALP